MSILTKTIGKLKEYRFFVPSYQRGYRWTEREVKKFLDDVHEFVAEGDKKYCIQPLIVKRRDDGSYEVVDGQQRLTTIYIFMKIAAQEIRSAIPPFDLEYETREDSAAFLKSLSDDEDLNKDKNIDYHHIASAYETINAWFSNQHDRSVAIQELNTKIRKSVFFIWYEIPPESDPIAVFTKVNLGKIPLTNAELIKALLLNKENFHTDSHKRQIEISLAWDRIEQGLRDDSFWYFLNEEEQSGTRIDMLFELLANEQNLALATPLSQEGDYFPFDVINHAIDAAPNKEQYVDTLWNSVKQLYAEFREWYSDLNKYHIIGYLIASGVTVKDIVALTRGKRKSAVLQDLLAKAKEKTKVKARNGRYDLSAIVYGNDNTKIKQLLLLFNLATLVCKSEKQYRFPFDVYKGETGERLKWDIEHIHATADETDDADDSLWNLTLLERSTNRSRAYACETFTTKRQIILDRESRGLFVPLCTKNIFLKAYSANLSDMEVWGSEDKKDYIAEMEKILETFFEGRFK
ncbi:DUF262 domain-containing protein [Cohnella fermenti]|uniref:DUF262 domain-containing protein n=1 Tax=Cohnella fermenti TaxID=2565925 RepID=A0A4S4BQ56_9BACL|nr:DUF262 domain-containing protein [Cohnella fermenti]THF76547.1 DUF262 domain-containing protein [Cohnella fermenti]